MSVIGETLRLSLWGRVNECPGLASGRIRPGDFRVCLLGGAEKMAVTELDAPLTLRLPKAAARRLSEAGFDTVEDLLSYAPLRYYQWGKLTDIGSLVEGESATLLVEVVNQNLLRNRNGGYRLVVIVTDGHRSLSCTFFAKNPYMLSHHQRVLKPGATVLVSGKVSSYRGQMQLVQPEFEEVEEGSAQDVARRAGRPIPIYRSVAGLASWKVASLIGSLLDQVEEDDVPQVLDEDTMRRHALVGYGQALRMLHQPEAPVDWQEAKRSLAWREALVLQTALLADRVRGDTQAPPLRATNGLDPSRSLVAALQRGLPFSLTEAQEQAWAQISGELEQTKPMQRLLQADVGAGKTVVALLAMVQTVEAGYQAAMLAPTEVLARQHYVSLTRMLEGAEVDIPVHLLTSKRASAEKNQVLASLAAGEPCIVVGTHALIQEGVEIPNLGLLVVDEQHRFGVAQREHLRQGHELTPHLLVMTATPIPRTIAMTVFGDLDVTAMKGLPPGRKKVDTFLIDERNQVWMDRVWERAREEVDGGGRVYVVCPRIDPDEKDKAKKGAEGEAEIPSALATLKSLKESPVFEGVEIGLAHGRLAPADNARTFADFASGKEPVLVATTVIEVGVDVPEATMMVILGGNRFGLSQLHQLRGRVGRSERASVCMITHPGDLAPETAERMRVIAGTSDGFELAEADLRLRKEGDVLGKNQSGAVSSLRFLSVRDDAAIISGARDTATEILRQDPQLSEHTALADAVRARAGEELVWLERN